MILSANTVSLGVVLAALVPVVIALLAVIYRQGRSDGAQQSTNEDIDSRLKRLERVANGRLSSPYVWNRPGRRWTDADEEEEPSS